MDAPLPVIDWTKRWLAREIVLTGVILNSTRTFRRSRNSSGTRSRRGRFVSVPILMAVFASCRLDRLKPKYGGNRTLISHRFAAQCISDRQNFRCSLHAEFHRSVIRPVRITQHLQCSTRGPGSRGRSVVPAIRSPPQALAWPQRRTRPEFVRCLRPTSLDDGKEIGDVESERQHDWIFQEESTLTGTRSLS